MAITTAQADKVLELYSAYFNRAADADGFTFWQNSFQSYSDNAPVSITTDVDKEAYSLQKIISDMANSTEYNELYPLTQSTTIFVDAIYDNLLNRPSDAEGLAFWSGHIDAETMTKEEAILNMIAGAKANTTDQGIADAALITNKNAVSKYFAETLKSNDLLLANSAFSGVTSDAETVTTAKATLDTAVNVGETTVLTTRVNLLTGTSDDDTFVGTSGGTNSTINLGDSLDGGAGTDTLKILSSLTSAIPSIVTKDIEDYVITNSGAGTFAISSQSTAPTTVTFLAGSDEAFTLSGLKTTTAVALESEAGQITLAFDAVTGTTDAIALKLNEVKSTASVDVGAGIETINLNVTGSATTLVDLKGADVSELKITGDQDLTITTALASTITTVDGSAVTGKLELSIATGGDVTLTGGSADDHFNVAGFDENDIIDGGDGTDTLSITNDFINDVNISNIEILEFTTATTQDLSLLTGAETFKFSDATGNSEYTNNESDFSHIMLEKTAGDFTATITSNTSADVLNIELLNSDLTTLTATDYETVNLKSSLGDGTGTVLNTVTTLTNTTAISKLVITGDTDLTITGALTNQVNVDASAFTGELTIIGSGLDDTLKGGTNDDMLTGGDGVDTFTGGTGDDNFVTLSSTDLDTTDGAVTDTITDFTTGTNTISGLGTAATATNYFEEVSSATDLTTLLAAADAKLDGTFQYYLDSFGGDSYLVSDVNGTGYTDVIKLTGTALTDIDISNIIA